jgi:hypothetical protein
MVYRVDGGSFCLGYTTVNKGGFIIVYGRVLLFCLTPKRLVRVDPDGSSLGH